MTKMVSVELINGEEEGLEWEIKRKHGLKIEFSGREKRGKLSNI
uniref:Uncharacterized protein n=1 Tax=Nelumbo nucifera TaxID=4432 RepID=A0A822Z784_NELNU|nr:TPA_asm: hypothetical protein HUJ06_013138 [Nelumbo nucifera]